MQSVRIITTARALIVQGDKLLLVSENKKNWYAPGGWLDGFESLNETCEREIFEELGMQIEINDIIKVCHYKIEAQNNEPFFENVNKIEHYFSCKPITMPQIDDEQNHWVDKDKGLVAHAKWFEIKNLEDGYENYNIVPNWIRSFFQNQNNKIFEN